MAERIYTPQQSAAIAERKKTLLISAAAGSGKTATLTQRIISSLTDRANPADVSRMLIVTFTRAAASEMRERIEAALRAALLEDPLNKHLSRQLLFLGGARISTIDSFCSDVVRRGAASLGISPSFRVADESERLLIASEVLNRLIEDAYEGRLSFISPDEFSSLADSVTGVRSEAQLSEILFSLAEKLSGFPEGIAYLSVCAERLSVEKEKPLDEREIPRIALENTAEMLSHYKRLYDDILADSKSLNGKALLLVPFIEREHAALLRLSSLLNKGYTAFSVAFRSEALFAERLPVVRSFESDFDEELYKAYRRVRKEFSEKYEEFCKTYFTFSVENIEDAYKSSLAFERHLAAFLAEYDERFQKEKHSRGICDFGDIEHYAYRLLVENGKKTSLAESITRAYDYVYIDEFQDTNSLQDAIFRAVSREDNLFMVGDVKQSIYGFRNAEPSIFAAYKRRFPSVEEASESPTASIFMSQNFRSDTPIIDFTNRIFDSLFELTGESIAYAKEDRLSAGKKQPAIPTPVEVWLCDRALTDASSEDEDEESEEGFDEEVTAVAKEISRLLSEGVLDDGTPVKPSDIAVLLRGGRADAEKFAEAIRVYGIPVSSEEDKDFFLKPEILLVLSLLNVIDNPYRDIPLAALLRSPLYRFTMDELITIRLGQSETASLFEALSDYAEKDGGDVGEKARGFLSELSSYRRMAEGIPVDRLLRHLYRETGLLGLSSEGDGGRQRRQHLLLLYQYARRFEASSFRGLYQFISYINTVIAENRRVSELESKGEDVEAVRIMTIHHSKGLEFPVTFLSRTAKRYNESDLSAPILFHRDLGAVTRFRDETGLARVGNLLYNVAARALERAGHEEEMRVLYVALTRARERLYVTARTQKTKPAEALLSEAAQSRRYLSPFEAYSYKSYLSLVLSTVTGDEPYVSVRTVSPTDDEAETVRGEVGEALTEGETVAVDADTLRRRFAYEYPHKAVSEMPQKLAVSHLYPAVLDESGEDKDTTVLSEKAEEVHEKSVRLPIFMTGDNEQSAARRGTATHLFMQFCDYERLKTRSVEEELSRLVSEKFITKEDADLVFVSELKAFRESDFFSELLSAKKLYRELRFHASLPAAEFTEEAEKKEALFGERVFVQGVMDCILVREDGEYSIVDYKTDRLSPPQKKDKRLAAQMLSERHGLQLSYYAAAATEIFGRPPRSLLIYSLPLGNTIEITPEKAIKM